MNRFAHQRMFLMQQWAAQTIELGRAFGRFHSDRDYAWSDGWGTCAGSIDWAVHELGG